MSSISAGQDFMEALEKNIAETDVMLVLIGKQWLNANDQTGEPRIHEPQDYVRREIATALKLGKAIVPVIFQKQPIPLAEQLPDDLVELAQKQVIEIRHNTFTEDVDRLVKDIQKLGKSRKSDTTYDFGKAIAEKYNSTFSMMARDEGLSYQIIFGSDHSIPTFWHSHQMKDLIVDLIENADLSGWMNSQEELQPEDFWNAILHAVAKSCRWTWDDDPDEYNDVETLHYLVDNLEEQDSGSKQESS